MSFGIENLNALLSKNENAEGTEHEILKKDVNNCKTAVTLVLTEVLKSVSGKVSSSFNGSTPVLPVDVDSSDAASMLKHLKEVSSKDDGSDLSRMCACMETLLETVSSLEERWSAQDSKLDKLKLATNDNEQYLMNYNLLWAGLSIPYHLQELEFSNNIV